MTKGATVLRILPLILALVAGACSRAPAAADTAQAPSDGAQDQDAAAQPVEPVPDELPDVLARVNGEQISRTEFEEAVRSVEQRVGTSVPLEERDRVYRSLLDQIIGHKLLVQETKSRGVSVPDAEIEKYIDEIRGRFPSDEAFQKELQEQQLTLDELREEARQDMAIAKMVDEEIADRVTVAPDELDTFYRENPEQFQEEERIRASHILIAVPPGADAEAKAAASTQAEELLRELDTGADFAALARQHSQDPGTAVQGGDLGYFERGQMVPAFDAAAFSLAVGGTSGIVETNFGYHIIRVTDKQPARTVPLEEVRPELEEFLEARNRREETEAFVNALRTQGDVEIYI